MWSSPESIRVLAVDDDPDFLAVTATQLERTDDRFIVETAPDAATGEAKLADTAFDCVVSDYEMPGRDGIEFLEDVRSDYSTLPFILFTGKGSEAVASRAISAAVTDYLQKQGGAEQYTILANRIENAVERTRAKRERERAERQFEAIFSDPDRLQGVLDADGRLRRVNDAAMACIDPDRSAVIGQPFWETPWWQSFGRDRARRLIERGLDGEYVTFESERIDTNGDERVFVEAIRPVTRDGEVVALVVTARDVTEHRRRERELRRYERMVNTMLESACIYDENERFVVVNEYLAEFYGTTRDALEGRQSNLIPKVRDQSDGDPFAALLAGERDEVRGEISGEFPYQGHEDLEYRLTPLHVDGDIEGVVAVTHEITELKDRERALEQQNERLDEFASVVAHDLRNPLGVATGRLELLEDDCSSEHLDPVGDALERMETLIDDLLTAAREGQPVEETTPVDLSAVVEDAWGAVATGDATLAVEEAVTVRAERGRLRQLFENLLGNAVQHGTADAQSGTDSPADAGTVTVRVGSLSAADGFYVADDGPGIPPDERSAVFDAGYSTQTDGTGFGLSIVESIVDAHGWEVDATDSETGGARFEISGVKTV
ncbi:MAG: PAS domain S-box protein [Halorhabdus sp.]